MKSRFVLRMSLLVLVGLASGCTSVSTVQHKRAALHTARLELQSGALSPVQEARLAELCPFGTPSARQGVNLGFTELVVHAGYALEHSGDLKIPLWVCERMDPSKLNGPFPRKDNFRSDPDLTGPRSELSDYKGSGYARGHHAPAEDFNTSSELMSDSFFLSNMSPQLGSVNSGAWAKLEARVRRWVGEDQVTWIITGVLLYDPAEDDSATADGWVDYYTIGAGVAVPTHLFKIVVSEDGAGNVRSTAYVVPNEKLPSGYKIDDYRKPIRWIEERAGIDFMPDLDPSEAQRLEAVVGPARSP